MDLPGVLWVRRNVPSVDLLNRRRGSHFLSRQQPIRRAVGGSRPSNSYSQKAFSQFNEAFFLTVVVKSRLIAAIYRSRS